MSGYVQPELPGMPTDAVIEVELDGVGYDLVREMNVADDAIKKWEERRKAAHDQLLKLIAGDSEMEATYAATWSGRSVAQVTVYTERRFSTKAFQSDHPVLYDSYRVPATRRRLTTDKTL